MYELRADEITLWHGRTKPTQHTIDLAAREANSRGWNGVLLDLFEIGGHIKTVNAEKWIGFAQPSDEVLR